MHRVHHDSGEDAAGRIGARAANQRFLRDREDWKNEECFSEGK
jgi:hypothetical protein